MQFSFLKCPTSRGLKSSSSVWCGGFFFRVRGLIRLVRKGMETHLSCQIQLCALLASKRREIFHFPHFSVRFSFFFFFLIFFTPSSSSSSSPRLCHSSVLSFIRFSPPSWCHAPVFFLFPVGVVEGHCAHWLTFREKRGRGGGEETRQEKKDKGEQWE